jgi:hypothetical protein
MIVVSYGPRAQPEREPPFGTPRTVTVRLVPFTQNRLIWRVGVNGGTGRASECCVPSAGRSHTSRMGDVSAELSSACRA